MNQVFTNRADYYELLVRHAFSERYASITGFTDLASLEARTLGEKFIGAAAATGFNVYRRQPKEFPIEGTSSVVLYANYSDRIRHFSLLLAAKEEIPRVSSIPYRVGRRASRFTGEWDDPELKSGSIIYTAGPKKGESQDTKECLETIIAFYPQSIADVTGTIGFLLSYAKQGGEHEIEGSWEIPDIRATGALSQHADIMGFEMVVANIATVSEGEGICILRRTSRFRRDEQGIRLVTNPQPITWRSTTLWLNGPMVQFVANDIVPV